MLPSYNTKFGAFWEITNSRATSGGRRGIDLNSGSLSPIPGELPTLPVLETCVYCKIDAFCACTLIARTNIHAAYTAITMYKIYGATMNHDFVIPLVNVGNSERGKHIV